MARVASISGVKLGIAARRSRRRSGASSCASAGISVRTYPTERAASRQSACLYDLLVPRPIRPELAGRGGMPEERVHWLTGLADHADADGRFTFGAVLVVKMVSALLQSGVPAESIQRAANEGFLKFQRTDEYLPYEPGPRSGERSRSFRRACVPGRSCFPRSTRCSASQARSRGADPPRRGGAVRRLPRCMVDHPGRGRAFRGQVDGTGGPRRAWLDGPMGRAARGSRARTLVPR